MFPSAQSFPGKSSRLSVEMNVPDAGVPGIVVVVVVVAAVVEVEERLLFYFIHDLHDERLAKALAVIWQLFTILVEYVLGFALVSV